MYNPFVLACNYALDELSKVHVDGLPRFESERQIVFINSSTQPIKPSTDWRDSQAKPDIVLVQWDLFVERFKRNQPVVEIPYSRSHSGGFCLSAEGLDLSWKAIRSTVEMKIRGLPKRVQVPTTFDKNFEDLVETAPYTSTTDKPESIVLPYDAPANTCEYNWLADPPSPPYLLPQIPSGIRLGSRRRNRAPRPKGWRLIRIP
jgi:hypothetical protein